MVKLKAELQKCKVIQVCFALNKFFLVCNALFWRCHSLTNPLKLKLSFHTIFLINLVYKLVNLFVFKEKLFRIIC